MRVYDKIKLILEEVPATRNSDNLLIWEWAKRKGLVGQITSLSKENFMLIKFETCRRARQAIQHSHPELRGSNYKVRQLKAKDYPVFLEKDGQTKMI